MAEVRGRLEILDCLRAVAVGAVLLFHYAFRGAMGIQLTEVSLPELHAAARYGYLGVQLFFVISGFIIAYSAEGRTASRFGVARFTRIYPAFVICMSITFIITAAFGAPRLHATSTQWAANLIIVSPLLHQPFMDGAYWSLVYELIFYMWVTLLLPTGWFFGKLKIVVFVWLVISAVNLEVASSVARRVFLTDQSGFFAAGLMIYEFFRGRGGIAAALLLAAATAVALTQATREAAELAIHYKLPFDPAVVAGLSAGAIGAVALCLKLSKSPFPRHVAVAIGGCTYPLYLLHQNIGYIMMNELDSLMPAWIIVVLTTILVTSLAFVVCRYLERPGQSFLRALFAARTRPMARVPVKPTQWHDRRQNHEWVDFPAVQPLQNTWIGG